MLVIVGPNSVGEIAADERLKVYPNPASNLVYVELPKTNNGAEKWMLTDMAGKAVRSGIVAQSQKFSLNVGELSPGVYVISISGNNSWHQRITVQP